MMSSTVADALTYYDKPDTIQTRLFIRLFDQFFDCLKVTNKLEGVLKRKDLRLPYTSAKDQRFKVSLIAHHNNRSKLTMSYVYKKWLKDTFLHYLNEWEKEVRSCKVSKREQSRMLLSSETRQGLRITGIILSF